MLLGRGEFRLQTEVRLLISSLFKKEEIIPDHLSGTLSLQGSLKVNEGAAGVDQRDGSKRRTWSQSKDHEPRSAGRLQKLGRPGKNLWHLERNAVPPTP